MPRGVFPHTNNHPHKSHMKKADVKDFVMFCFREDIAKQLEGLVYPHHLAIELYKRETGKEVSAQTAYKQHGRWMMIDGQLCEIRKRKDFVPPTRPKAPKRSAKFVPPTRPATPPPTMNAEINVPLERIDAKYPISMSADDSVSESQISENGA